MWASGIIDLGLTDAQFWSLTLREHKALAARRRGIERAQDRSQDRRAALVAAVIANCHRDPNKRADPFTELDFMPGERPAQSKGIHLVPVEDQIEMARRDTEILRKIMGGR